MQKNVIQNDSRDDITLINSFLEGNKHDFEVLWFRYNRLIYAYILKMVRNIDDVDDILQETYNQSYPFPAWLYKIASNT
jgi:DNA-directed RNA polymerase specialized sigma24 family protein